MDLAVHLTWSGLLPADVASRIVVIVDVLRASSTIATALHHGALEVIPAAGPDSARARAGGVPGGRVLLTGERHARRIPGFDLGNSPLEFAREIVAGKTIVLTTTNGTSALLSVERGARDVVVGSYVNFSVVLRAVRSALQQGTDVAIVCAGSDRRFSLEDAACAGRFARFVAQTEEWGATVRLNDAARASLLIENHYAEDIARLFADADHGRALRDAGFGADLEACAQVDACPVVPRWDAGRLRAR
jgi:2-phosphosulfolactate phosphatase